MALPTEYQLRLQELQQSSGDSMEDMHTHVRILQVAEVVSTTEYQLRLQELQHEEAAAAAAAAAEAARAALQAVIDALQKV